MANTVLIRVDASKITGSGHLMRCLLVADYFKSKNINITFLSRSEQIENWIVDKGFKVKILPSYSTIEDELSIIKNLIIQLKVKVLILDINNYNTFSDLDTYHSYLENLRKLSIYLVSFEDLKDYPYTSDIVIIPYFGAEKIKLNKKFKCKYLLGHKYFPLREEFLKVKPVIIRKKVENILVTMGGSDSKGITLKVLEALNDIELDLSLKVVIGGLSHITTAEINDVLKSYNGTYSVVKNVGNMAQIMSESDIAIINSGLTKYEISAVGLPGIVISNNEKHCKVMDKFTKYGSVMHLGLVSAIQKHQIIEAVNTLVNNYNRRKLMSHAGKSLIDGKAMDRIFSEIPKDLIYA